MKFKCAVIGLGRIGASFDDKSRKSSINTHTKAYFRNKRVELSAFCDVDRSKLMRYGKKYDVQNLYTDYRELFKNQDLDCVSICTLADSHFDIVQEAAKYSVKGIFLEKPISDSLESAGKIIQLCKEKRVRLQIDYQRRFDPFYQHIRDLIKNDKLGKIQHVNICYGAGIANTGSHIFDLIRFFFNEIEWAEGAYSRNLSNNPSDPNVDGTVACKNGTICTIHSFDVNNYVILEFDIIGTKARIRLNLTNSTAEYFEISHNQKGLLYRELEAKKYAFPKKTDAIVLGLENLLYSIENNVEPLCRGEDGYYSLEAIIAMLESANKNGDRIYLPLKTNTYKISSK